MEDTHQDQAHSLPVASQSINGQLELTPSQEQLLKKVKLPNGSEEPSEFERELLNMTQAARDLENDDDQSWSRPPLPSDFNPDLEDISFQQLDAEEHSDDIDTYARFLGSLKKVVQCCVM